VVLRLMGSAATPRTVIGAANPWVWCERCQRVHRYYTFTKEDEERILAENVAKLRDAIDQQIMNGISGKVENEVLETFKAGRPIQEHQVF
jgi:hypothetical protein